jgi:hypothetical protein
VSSADWPIAVIRRFCTDLGERWLRPMTGQQWNPQEERELKGSETFEN